MSSALIAALEGYFLSGAGFRTIVEARQFASSFSDRAVEAGTPAAKRLEESLEVALVRVGRQIVREGRSPTETYAQLVDLYQRQPTLGTRSSSSVLAQAYSTPLPIAYLAGYLAGIDETTRVYEPSAGHGALLLLADPARTTANELNPERAANLRNLGFEVSERNATEYLPEGQHDIVIANPPFGSVRNAAGEVERFNTGQYVTTQIDCAIALKALEAMKPDGRAVLILGGQLGQDEEKRSDRYNSQQARAFYYSLYQRYNVVDHLSVWGDLYRRQGAGFPIDLIAIEGQGLSQRDLPAADVPRIYRSFEDLQEIVSHVESLRNTRPVQIAHPRDRSVRPTVSAPIHSGVTAAESRPDRVAGGLPRVAVYQAGMDDRSVVRGSATIDGGDLSGDLPLFNWQQNLSEHAGDDRRPVGVESSGGDGQPGPGREVGQTRGGLSPSSGDRPGGTGVSDGRHPQHNIGGVDVGTGPRTPSGLGNPADGRQVPYYPRSKGRSVETLVPVNMALGNQQALDRLEREEGPIDAYVAERLQYGSAEELHRRLSAEQVDAVGLGLFNLERGSGFIVGDQTGIGKGRVVASAIRYAILTGRTPIFVTKDPGLYADMMRDLGDLGMEDFRPFATNSDIHIPLPNGSSIRNSSKTHQQGQKQRVSRPRGRRR